MILFIACINFVNLFTAQALKRGKEIAVRKVNGVKRWQLIQQFLAEALLTALMASCLSLACILLILPWYNQQIEAPLSYCGGLTRSRIGGVRKRGIRKQDTQMPFNFCV